MVDFKSFDCSEPNKELNVVYLGSQGLELKENLLTHWYFQ